MKKLIAQFVPMVFILLFLSKNKEFFQFSKTIVGKIVAIFIILFYVSVDKFVGLFVCALIVLFYQSENIEAMETMGTEEIAESSESNDVDDGTYSYLDDSSKIKASSIDVIEKKVLTLGNTSSARQQLIPSELGTPTTDIGPIFRGNEDEFRQKNCVEGVLKHKNMNVKSEMAEHIFPEFKFREGVCNPCSKTCEISIIEGKLKTENEIKPSFTRP